MEIENSYVLSGQYRHIDTVYIVPFKACIVKETLNMYLNLSDKTVYYAQ